MLPSLAGAWIIRPWLRERWLGEGAINPSWSPQISSNTSESGSSWLNLDPGNCRDQDCDGVLTCSWSWPILKSPTRRLCLLHFLVFHKHTRQFHAGSLIIKNSKHQMFHLSRIAAVPSKLFAINRNLTKNFKILY